MPPQLPPKLAQIDRLKATLLDSGLQQKNQPLWQVINTLIDYLRQLQTFVSGSASGSSSGGGGSSLADQSFITVNNDTVVLPNSRQAIAGTGIALDTSIPGQIIISSTVTSPEWDVLTDGDIINPEFIFADGEVIMVQTP